MRPQMAVAIVALAIGAATLGGTVLPLRPIAVDPAARTLPPVPRIAHAGVALGNATAMLGDLDDPGARFAAEEAQFAASQLAEQAAPVVPVAAAAPPPPPPDMSYAIGGAVAAIDRSTGRAELILAEGGANRRLAAGGEYRDGWRLIGVEGQTILLARGREQRRVPIRYGAPDPAPATVVAATVAGPPRASAAPAVATAVAGAGEEEAADQEIAPQRPRRLLRRPGKT